MLRRDATGQKDLDRIEYALGTIGKALILTDYSVDEEKDMDKLKAFREAQQSGLSHLRFRQSAANRRPTGKVLRSDHRTRSRCCGLSTAASSTQRAGPRPPLVMRSK